MTHFVTKNSLSLKTGLFTACALLLILCLQSITLLAVKTQKFHRGGLKTSKGFSTSIVARL